MNSVVKRKRTLVVKLEIEWNPKEVQSGLGPTSN